MPPDPALVQAATDAANQYGVPVSLFLGQIQQESSFNPNAQNGPASGIAQFMPGTAAQFGINPYDPVASLNAAAQYDAQLYAQTGSWSGALQRYGTVPASGVLTPSQQTLLSQAQSLDQGGVGVASASGGNPLLTQVSFPGSQFLGSVLSGASSWLWNLFMRIVVILMGLVLIWQGLAMMRGTSVKEDVTVVVNTAKRKGQSTTAEVEKAA